MGDYGSEFVNVGTLLPPGFGDVLSTSTINWAEFTERLKGEIRRLANSGGGYIYFPPGVYRPRGFAVVPNVTIVFAPGARLELRVASGQVNDRFADVSVTIQGGLQAGPFRIVNATMQAGRPNDRGGLIFQTDTVREVYPEWWGAEPSDVRQANGGFDSADSIQSCFDAAIHGMQYGPAIPIIFSGVYEISRPLYVGYREWALTQIPSQRPRFANNELDPFKIIGRTGPSSRGRPTLAPHENFSRQLWSPASTSVSSVPVEDLSLLIIRGPSGFSIEGVSFEGTRLDGFIDDAAASPSNPFPLRAQAIERVFSCVRLERHQRATLGPNGQVIGGGSAQGSRFYRCRFAGAVGPQVQIGEYRNPYQPPDQTLRLTGGQDLLGLVFEHCLFASAVRPPEFRSARFKWDSVAASTQWLRDGVYFRANNTLRLHFVDCFWHGMMRTGIRAFSGSLTITNCNFHIGRMPIPNSVGVENDSRYSVASDPMRHSGDGNFVFSESIHETIARGRPKIVDARDNGCNIYVESFGYGPNTGQFTAGIFVRGVESQSWRFLSSFPATTFTVASAAFPGFDVYLEDVHHSAAVTTDFVPVSREDPLDALYIVPPGIEWLGPFTLGSSITLNGVQLANASQRRGLSLEIATNLFFTPWSDRVVIGPPSISIAGGSFTRFPRVIDLGTRTAGGYFGAPSQSVGAIYASGTGTAQPSEVSTVAQPWYLSLASGPHTVG